jgi:hypothetical protein
MKSIDLSLCQLRSSSFRFIDLFPPKESMKEFVENRGRQDETAPQTIIAEIFLTVGTQPHLSNIDIVVAILRTLQTSARKLLRQACGHLKIRKRVQIAGGQCLTRQGLRASKFRTVI